MVVESSDALQNCDPVVKRSYRGLLSTLSASLNTTLYQIPLSALMQTFHGCGSVAVLVMIRDMSRSQIVTVAVKSITRFQ
jgi:hypothetical protein